MGIGKTGAFREDEFGEFVHFINKRLDRIAYLSTASKDISSDVVGDGESGIVIGSQEGSIESVSQSHCIADFEADGSGLTEKVCGFWDGNRCCTKIRHSRGRPIDSDDGGGNFRQRSN